MDNYEWAVDGPCVVCGKNIYLSQQSVQAHTMAHVRRGRIKIGDKNKVAAATLKIEYREIKSKR